MAGIKVDLKTKGCRQTQSWEEKEHAQWEEDVPQEGVFFSPQVLFTTVDVSIW